MRFFYFLLFSVLLISGCEKEFGVMPDDSGLYQKVYGNLNNNGIFDEGAANTGVALAADYTTDEIYAIGSVGEDSDSIVQKIYVFKTDKNGFLLEELFLGDSLINQGVDIMVVEDGAIVCGLSKSNVGDTGGQIFLSKIDKSLKVTWQKYIDINGSDGVPSAINLTETGEIVLLGNYIDFQTDKLTTFISLFNGEGDLLIEKPYDSDNVNSIVGKTVLEVRDDFVWCGTDLKSSITKMNFFSANSEGDAMAFPVLKDDNSKDEIAREIHHISGEDYIMIGSINYDPDNEDNKTSDIELSMLNVYEPTDALQWSKTYGGEGFDEGISVAQAIVGGYIILGNTESFGSGGTDFYLIKTDNMGEVIWEKTFGGDGDEEAAKVISFNDGYAFIGTAIIADRRLITIIRTDLEGNIIKN